MSNIGDVVWADNRTWTKWGKRTWCHMWDESEDPDVFRLKQLKKYEDFLWIAKNGWLVNSFFENQEKVSTYEQEAKEFNFYHSDIEEDSCCDDLCDDCYEKYHKECCSEHCTGQRDFCEVCSTDIMDEDTEELEDTEPLDYYEDMYQNFYTAPSTLTLGEKNLSENVNEPTRSGAVVKVNNEFWVRMPKMDTNVWVLYGYETKTALWEELAQHNPTVVNEGFN